MKASGLYIILSLYSISRWGTEYFASNYDWFDANILYFVCDGAIISLIGFFLYLNSNRDYVSKACLALMVMLGGCQGISFIYSHFYNKYILYLPVIVIMIAALEAYKFVSKKDFSNISLKFASMLEDFILRISNKFKK